MTKRISLWKTDDVTRRRYLPDIDITNNLGHEWFQSGTIDKVEEINF